MNILLVNPSISGPDADQLDMREPLGLAYIAAYLREHGHEVEILDFYAMGQRRFTKVGDRYRSGLNDEEAARELSVRNPDCIGIACSYTVFSKDSIHAAALCRKAHPDIPIAVGGAHATNLTEDELLELPMIDITIRGEGEQTMLELVEALARGDDLSTVTGAMVKTGTSVVTNANRPPVDDVDSLPMPARDLLDMQFYMNNSDIYGHVKHPPAAALITSRGCPFDCVFCSAKSVWTRKWRGHSPERVLAEIRVLVEEYGVREILIYDDNFITNKQRALRIVELIEQSGLDIAIAVPSGVPVALVDEEILTALKRVGLYRVVLPIETGCESTLEFIRKNIDLPTVRDKVEMCHRLGLWTSGNFIIGFPYETREDVEQTIEFSLGTGLDFAFYFIAQPLVGSDLFTIFKEEHLLVSDRVDSDSKVFSTRYDIKNLTADELQAFRDKAADTFMKQRLRSYLTPSGFIRHMWPKIRTIDGFLYAMKLMFSGRFMRLIFNRETL